MKLPSAFNACLAIVAVYAIHPYASAATAAIAIGGTEAYPESVTAGPDGTLYVGSLSSYCRSCRACGRP
jgi:hypothetical protein